MEREFKGYQIWEYLGGKFKVSILKISIISILFVTFGSHLLKLHTFILEILRTSGFFGLGCTIEGTVHV